MTDHKRNLLEQLAGVFTAIALLGLGLVIIGVLVGIFLHQNGPMWMSILLTCGVGVMAVNLWLRHRTLRLIRIEADRQSTSKAGGV